MKMGMGKTRLPNVHVALNSMAFILKLFSLQTVLIGTLHLKMSLKQKSHFLDFLEFLQI